MPILSCPGCARGGLRVPDGKRGKVTCPTCGAEWFYPEEIELSEVSFRCAKSGAHFSVILSRRSKQHPFVIEKIRRPMPAAESPLGQSAPVTSKSMVDPESASMRLRGSLTRLLDRFVGSSSPPAMSSGGSSSPVESVSPGDQHDAGDYNWSGFSCPYCGDVSFVRCSGGHLVCQGPPRCATIVGSIAAFAAEQAISKAELRASMTGDSPSSGLQHRNDRNQSAG
jgi:predicted RNA-binding Zn-ribbon protein involved in translation (DUF1610 family)